MGVHSCPVCARIVPPLGSLAPERAGNGHERDAAAGELPIESRTCPACRAALERSPPGAWKLAQPSPAGALEPRRRFTRGS